MEDLVNVVDGVSIVHRCYWEACEPSGRVLRRFFGTRDFPYLKLRTRDLKAKSGRVSGLKVCLGDGMPKIILGITGLHEILGQGYGIEVPYWGPSPEKSLVVESGI